MSQLREFWNLPNTITAVRVMAVPVIVGLMMDGSFARSWAAGWIFIFAIIGDFLDGYLARKLNLQSKMGAFLDPLADKLIISAVLIMLIPLGRVEAWLVVVLLTREVTITSLRAVAANDGVVIAASKWGKYKTAYQATALSLLCLHYPFFGVDLHRVGYGVLLVATLFSLWSAWDYLAGYARSLRAA